MDDEKGDSKPASFVAGQDVSTLGRDELEALIETLRGEIARIEAELASRDDSRSAADAFFRK